MIQIELNRIKTTKNFVRYESKGPVIVTAYVPFNMVQDPAPETLTVSFPVEPARAG